MPCGCGKSQRATVTEDTPNPNEPSQAELSGAWWQAHPAAEPKPSTVAVPMPS